MTDAADASATPQPAPPLSTRERAELKARAHSLDPVVRVGHAGVTDNLIANIDRALQAHELIKVKIGEGEREARAEATAAIVARTGAALVQQVGRVIVLWRPAPGDEEAAAPQVTRDKGTVTRASRGK